jgi:zinc/manganese transport system substrate-binding protein
MRSRVMRLHVPAARARASVRPTRLLLATATIGLLATVAGIGRAQDAPLRVCATTPDLGALVRAVGGDDVSITVFVKGTEDPHHAEAKPSFVKALHDADLFVQNGLDLELGYVPVLLQQARNPRIAPGAPGFLDGAAYAGQPLDVPTGIVDRSMGDVHASGNPHYLLDPLRGVAVASAIASRLGELRPSSKAAFTSRLGAFRRSVYVAMVGDALAQRYGDDVPKLELLYRGGELASFLDAQGQRAELGGWLGALLPHRGANVVDDHRLWPYFADAFGLTVVGHLEPLPGVPPTTKHLEAVIDTIKRLDVKLVLASAYYDPRYAELVAKNTGAVVARIANQVGALPGTDDYVAMLSYDVRQVVAALDASR